MGASVWIRIALVSLLSVSFVPRGALCGCLETESLLRQWVSPHGRSFTSGGQHTAIVRVGDGRTLAFRNDASFQVQADLYAADGSSRTDLSVTADTSSVYDCKRCYYASGVGTATCACVFGSTDVAAIRVTGLLGSSPALTSATSYTAFGSPLLVGQVDGVSTDVLIVAGPQVLVVRSTGVIEDSGHIMGDMQTLAAPVWAAAVGRATKRMFVAVRSDGSFVTLYAGGVRHNALSGGISSDVVGDIKGFTGAVTEQTQGLVWMFREGSGSPVLSSYTIDETDGTMSTWMSRTLSFSGNKPWATAGLPLVSFVADGSFVLIGGQSGTADESFWARYYVDFFIIRQDQLTLDTAGSEINTMPQGCDAVADPTGGYLRHAVCLTPTGDTIKSVQIRSSYPDLRQLTARTPPVLSPATFDPAITTYSVIVSRAEIDSFTPYPCVSGDYATKERLLIDDLQYELSLDGYRLRLAPGHTMVMKSTSEDRTASKTYSVSVVLDSNVTGVALDGTLPMSVGSVAVTSAVAALPTIAPVAYAHTLIGMAVAFYGPTSAFTFMVPSGGVSTPVPPDNAIALLPSLGETAGSTVSTGTVTLVRVYMEAKTPMELYDPEQEEDLWTETYDVGLPTSLGLTGLPAGTPTTFLVRYYAGKSLTSWTHDAHAAFTTVMPTIKVTSAAFVGTGSLTALSLSGGDTLVVAGANFSDIASPQVAVGTFACASATVVNDTAINCVTGPGVGTGLYVSLTAFGQVGTAPNVAGYVAPKVSSVTPSAASMGATVTVTGSNFLSPVSSTSVYLGAPAFTCTNATVAASSIRCSLPLGVFTAGRSDVHVDVGGQTSTGHIDGGVAGGLGSFIVADWRPTTTLNESLGVRFSAPNTTNANATGAVVTAGSGWPGFTVRVASAPATGFAFTVFVGSAVNSGPNGTSVGTTYPRVLLRPVASSIYLAGLSGISVSPAGSIGKEWRPEWELTYLGGAANVTAGIEFEVVAVDDDIVNPAYDGNVTVVVKARSSLTAAVNTTIHTKVYQVVSNDTAGIIVTLPEPAFQASNETMTGIVTLATVPSSPVNVSIVVSGDPAPPAAAVPSSVLIDATNWNTGVPFSLTPLAGVTTADGTGIAPYVVYTTGTSTDPFYNQTTGEADAFIVDDAVLEIARNASASQGSTGGAAAVLPTVVASSFNVTVVTEGAAFPAASLHALLSGFPVANSSLFGNLPLGQEETIEVVADVQPANRARLLDTKPLVFKRSDFAVPRRVVVVVDNDDVDYGGRVTVSVNLRVSRAGANSPGTSAPVVTRRVAVAEDDVAGVVVTAGPCTTHELGTAVKGFEVALRSRPAAGVTLRFTTAAVTASGATVAGTMVNTTYVYSGGSTSTWASPLPVYVAGTPDREYTGTRKFSVVASTRGSADTVYAALADAEVLTCDVVDNVWPTVGSIRPFPISALIGSNRTISGSGIIASPAPTVAMIDSQGRSRAAKVLSVGGASSSSSSSGNTTTLRARQMRQGSSTATASTSAVDLEVSTPAGAKGYATLVITNADGGTLTLRDALYYTDDCPEPGQFGIGNACRACDANAECPGGYRMWPKPGYWTPDESHGRVYQCSPSVACLGGRDSECAPGYTSELCGTCAEGYYRDGPFCYQCDDSDASGYSLVLIDVAFCAFLALAITLLPVSHLNNAITTVSVLQLVRTLGQAAGDRLPSGLRRVYEVLALSQLDVGFTKPQCFSSVAGGSFLSTFWGTMVQELLFRGAVIVLLPLHGWLRLRRLRAHSAAVARKAAKERELNKVARRDIGGSGGAPGRGDPNQFDSRGSNIADTTGIPRLSSSPSSPGGVRGTGAVDGSSKSFVRPPPLHHADSLGHSMAVLEQQQKQVGAGGGGGGVRRMSVGPGPLPSLHIADSLGHGLAVLEERVGAGGARGPSPSPSPSPLSGEATAAIDHAEGEEEAEDALAAAGITWRTFAALRMPRGLIIATAVTWFNLLSISLRMIHCVRIEQASVVDDDGNVVTESGSATGDDGSTSSLSTGSTTVLLASPDLECWTGNHVPAAIVSILLIVFNAIVYPHVALWWMHVNRDAIETGEQGMLLRYGYFWERFGVKRWWAMIAQLDATLILVCAVSVVPQSDETLQFSLMLSAMLLLFLLYLVAAPLKVQWRNLAVSLIIASLIFGLGINYAARDGSGVSDAALLRLEIAALVVWGTMIAAGLTYAVVMWRTGRWNAQGDASVAPGPEGEGAGAGSGKSVWMSTSVGRHKHRPSAINASAGGIHGTSGTAPGTPATTRDDAASDLELVKNLASRKAAARRGGGGVGGLRARGNVANGPGNGSGVAGLSIHATTGGLASRMGPSRDGIPRLSADGVGGGGGSPMQPLRSSLAGGRLPPIGERPSPQIARHGDLRVDTLRRASTFSMGHDPVGGGGPLSASQMSRHGTPSPTRDGGANSPVAWHPSDPSLPRRGSLALPPIDEHRLGQSPPTHMGYDSKPRSASVQLGPSGGGGDIHQSLRSSGGGEFFGGGDIRQSLRSSAQGGFGGDVHQSLRSSAQGGFGGSVGGVGGVVDFGGIHQSNRSSRGGHHQSPPQQHQSPQRGGVHARHAPPTRQGTSSSLRREATLQGAYASTSSRRHGKTRAPPQLHSSDQDDHPRAHAATTGAPGNSASGSTTNNEFMSRIDEAAAEERLSDTGSMYGMPSREDSVRHYP